MRINYKSVYNLRDLGGIPVKNGYLKFNQLLRSDQLINLLDEEKEDLLKRGVSIDIDLRNNQEIKKSIDVLSLDHRFKYYHTPILDFEPETYHDTPITLESEYFRMLNYSTSIATAIKIIANSGNRGVLIHCTAGKDRTGVITALILSILNVEIGDILANYEVSSSYLIPKYGYFDDAKSKIEMNFMQSKRETLNSLLKYLEQEFGSIKEYLYHIGVTNEDMSKIIRKMVN